MSNETIVCNLVLPLRKQGVPNEINTMSKIFMFCLDIQRTHVWPTSSSVSKTEVVWLESEKSPLRLEGSLD